jgi:hypothetical protein
MIKKMQSPEIDLDTESYEEVKSVLGDESYADLDS